MFQSKSLAPSRLHTPTAVSRSSMRISALSPAHDAQQRDLVHEAAEIKKRATLIKSQQHSRLPQLSAVTVQKELFIDPDIQKINKLLYTTGQKRPSSRIVSSQRLVKVVDIRSAEAESDQLLEEMKRISTNLAEKELESAAKTERVQRGFACPDADLFGLKTEIAQQKLQLLQEAKFCKEIAEINRAFDALDSELVPIPVAAAVVDTRMTEQDVATQRQLTKDMQKEQLELFEQLNSFKIEVEDDFVMNESIQKTIKWFNTLQELHELQGQRLDVYNRLKLQSVNLKKDIAKHRLNEQKQQNPMIKQFDIVDQLKALQVPLNEIALMLTDEVNEPKILDKAKIMLQTDMHKVLQVLQQRNHLEIDEHVRTEQEYNKKRKASYTFIELLEIQKELEQIRSERQ